MSLPSIGDALASSSSLESALSILFEPSTSLKHHLVPSLSSQLSSSSSSSSTSNTGHVKTYTELVDLSQQEISTWSLEEKADFIGGHPRIGEVSNLSALSTKEQASKATPPEVLARLESLNALYEACYPKLRYITFVAGRSRAQVAQDLEKFLMSGTGEKDDEGNSAPPTTTHDVGSEQWCSELERALKDIFLIAKARLRGLGVE